MDSRLIERGAKILDLAIILMFDSDYVPLEPEVVAHGPRYAKLQSEGYGIHLYKKMSDDALRDTLFRMIDKGVNVELFSRDGDLAYIVTEDSGLYDFSVRNDGENRVW